MGKKERLVVVIPSRERPHNCARLKKLVPFAYLFVDKRELATYAAVWPRKQIVTHNGVNLAHEAYNLALRTFQEEALVKLDDDLKAVIYRCGRISRVIRDADHIWDIFQVAHQVLQDLDLTVWAWSRRPSGMLRQTLVEPFQLNGLCTAAFMVRGAARHRPMDDYLRGRPEPDLSLRILQEDRVFITDHRYYFDFGPCFSGTGGNVGRFTDEMFREGTERLLARWGRWVSVSGGTAKNTSNIVVKVPRRNPIIVNGNPSQQEIAETLT